jgi:indolepyruvate ferredoxin oxidoreductase beta subunit
MKYNIIISGIGGQGVVTCGSLISKASIHRGLNAIMSEIHGLAQRGGSVSVEVRLGDVHGPIIPNGEGDLLIGLEYMEGIRNIPRMKDGSTVILSLEKLTPVSLSMKGKEYPDMENILNEAAKRLNIYEIEAETIALEAGDKRTSNSVIMGFLSALNLAGLNDEDFINAIDSTFSDKTKIINHRAFELGVLEKTRAKLRQNNIEIDKYIEEVDKKLLK